MRRHRERLELNADINVVSLIDVMMLLMVIFMITAPMMQGGVDVALPTAEVRPIESNRGLAVTVTREGRIFVGETALSFEEFRGSFRRWRRHGEAAPGSTCGPTRGCRTAPWCACSP
jgi:biopolymer transport protein ExbD/biopolymer transport protein TolR